jgi:hypothetical protein
MLDQIYLSKECCDKLHFDYKDQKSTVTLDPALALSLREWDSSHRRTFQTFIHHNQTMVLEPVMHPLRKQFGDGGQAHERGWYTVTNPPQTRVFVTTDIDTELLREQRDVLLKISDNLSGKDEKLVSGIIIMLDHMLDSGEGS